MTESARALVGLLRSAGFRDGEILVIVTAGYRELQRRTVEDSAALDAWLERVERGPESSPAAVH